MYHFENAEKTDRIRRITEMETRFDRISHVLQETGVCPDRLDAIRDDIQTLSEYSEGSLWREDFEADEAGLLPQDLKRGVLSEDAVYDLLTEYDALKSRLQEPGQKQE